MKSDQKSKRRGRSSSPKKKLKRKYRNDRSKKGHDSSSESEQSSEDASLTSDEYPSSGDERRKDARKKRSKKTKHKPRASVSSSRSPSPDKSKKKKKDRKSSPTLKKKRKRSSDSKDNSSDDESSERNSAKKEKLKKKRSPSPPKSKRKRSPSPTSNGSSRQSRKKSSVSPIRSKKKASPSPEAKERRSRSRSPNHVKRKIKSPTKDKKKSPSPSPPRTKKNVSPGATKRRSKSRSPSSKSRKRSPSPSSYKSDKKTSSSKTRNESPTSRPKKRDSSPSSPRAARKSEHKPSTEGNTEKKKVHGPALPSPSSLRSPSPHASKSGPPPSPGLPPNPPRTKPTNGDERKVSKASKEPRTPTESKKSNAAPDVDTKKKSGLETADETKKRTFTPLPAVAEKVPVKKLPLSAKEIAKKVIAAKASLAHDGEKKVVLPKPPGDEEKNFVAMPTDKAKERVAQPVQKLDQKSVASKEPIKESEKNVPKSVNSVDSASVKVKVEEEEVKDASKSSTTTNGSIATPSQDSTSPESAGKKVEGESSVALKGEVKKENKDEAIEMKIKTSLLVMKKKKITIAPTLKALTVKEETSTSAKKDDLIKKEDIKKEDIKKEETKKDSIKKEGVHNDGFKKEDLKKDGTKKEVKTPTDSSSKTAKTSSPTVFRSRKKSSSPTRNRKKSRSASPRTRKRSKSPSPRSRKRSKSPRRDRKRSRSRSRSPSRRDRRDDKARRRSRSRSADKDSKKKKDREEKDRRNRRDDKDKDRKKKDEKDSKIKKEKSPEKDITDVEEEMKKRKERIEAWRNANKKKGEGSESSEKAESSEAKVKEQKKWSLEDDDEEDEDQVDQKKGEERRSKKEVKDTDVKKEEEDEEEEDPLEAFMKSIDSQVNKLSGGPLPVSTTGGTKTKTITVVKTVTVNKQPVQEVKPEVMEQNQDALEYSSEEEEKSDITASDFDAATKKKKELTIADHSMIYYAAFRRDFYVEVPELARMSADEVKVLRESLGDVQVRGKNCPKPIKSWAQAGLSSKTMSVLKRCEYEKPTPIQAQALPVVMSGRDMIGIAKTGSGKTLAFVLPMLRHVLDQPALDEEDGPIAIIMTPTRELALQIYRETKKFCKPLNLTVTCIYGGSGISEQIAELKKGTEIIVCTPGRMIDMLAANNGKVTNCRRCTYLVMDEADRMFDMGFEPQVMRIIGNIRPDRQTVLFSATFPRQMEAVARKVLQKPIEIQVGGRSIVCSDVEQHALVIDEDNKFFKILELLGIYQEESSILIFVERQETADRLFKDLLKKGYPCLSLHGGMDQFDRDSTIADFKNGVSKLMVSTSVAARGLDVKNLNLVINYDCPNHYEDYVHRVGRTGRAGNKGTSFTFVTPEQGRNACDVIKAFELSKSEPPADVVELWTSFKADMESAGKTIKVNSGFSGTKGFKFNAEEDAMVQDWKKLRKFQLGQQDSDEEAEAADDAISKIEADLEKAFSNKPKIALQPEVLEKQKVQASEQNVDKDKIKQAALAAELINKKLSSGQVVDRNTAATAHILQGGALESLTGVGLAKQLADKVNAKLNYKAAEVEPEVEAKPVAVRYEEEIDINDFPQQARWRITSKEIIEQVREVSEAGVTVRGVYIPPNKKPDEEERRLHLYIESLSERSIQIAKAEIKRLLKDELLRSETNSYRPQQPTGRYKVL